MRRLEGTRESGRGWVRGWGWDGVVVMIYGDGISAGAIGRVGYYLMPQSPQQESMQREASISSSTCSQRGAGFRKALLGAGGV